MELQEYLLELLINNTENIDKIEIADVLQSLKEAIDRKQYLLFNNDQGEFAGFVTWKILINEKDNSKINLLMGNLIVLKECRSTFQVNRLKNYLKTMYPNLEKFIWHNRKRQKIFQSKREYATI